MKLYDGRGQRFKKLIATKVIMKENRLKLTEVIPKHARKKWSLLYLHSSLCIFLFMCLFAVLIATIDYFVLGHFSDDFFDIVYAGLINALFYGLIFALFSHKWTWQSNTVAIQALAIGGFCPNCGYIIRGTHADSDGCTPCSECGHAWRVEPVES